MKRHVQVLAKLPSPMKRPVHVQISYFWPMHSSENTTTNTAIYLAPLQGFTDFVYRKAYNSVFSSVDAFFIPYISVKNDAVPHKYQKEVRLENNPQQRVVPQVLPKDADEIIFLSKMLENLGYSEINLNLGCPYPMVTKRGKGAGLLPHPEEIGKMLDAFHGKTNLKLSVKLRAGLISAKEIEEVIPVLNQFPLTEVILHPRIAKQLYSGEIIHSAFEFAAENLTHKLISNGDIFTMGDFDNNREKYPKTGGWMLGRGILMNPFLPDEINGKRLPDAERHTKLKEFHQEILEGYLETMDNEGNVLNKMKQFWIYFSYNFQDQRKALKLVKKINKLNSYSIETNRIFRRYD